MANELETLKKTVSDQAKVISLTKELVELINSRAYSGFCDDSEIIEKAQALSYNQTIIMAVLP